MAAVTSFVAEAVRSVRVSSGASRLRSNSEVFLELGLFMDSFVPVDVLLARSNTFSVTDFGVLLLQDGGFFQFYLIIVHKHLIWFIFVGL
jgi:hypothetical protein